MSRHLRAQLVDKFLLHKCVIVRNVQDDCPLAVHERPELRVHFLQMRFLHHQDNVRPAYMSFADDDACPGLSSSGAHLPAAHTMKYFLRSEAANTIPAANE